MAYRVIENRNELKVKKTLRLQIWLWKLLDKRKESRAVIIEKALRGYFKELGGNNQDI